MLIEKGIPLPKQKAGRNAIKTGIPFDQMEVGDSVLVEYGTVETDNLYSLVKVHAYRKSQQTGKKFITRKVQKGIRVWRSE